MKRHLYALLARYLRYRVPAGATVVEIGPRNRLLIDAWGQPAFRVFQPAVPDEFAADERIDSWDALIALQPTHILLNGHLHYEQDIQSFLDQLAQACGPATRVLITYYSSLWRPVFRLLARFGISTKGVDQNWLAPSDVANLLSLSRFELISEEPRVLVPVYVPVIGPLLNRWITPLPLAGWAALVRIAVARMRPLPVARPSVSVVIPVRNERGNIEAAIQRLPAMGPDDEIIFVEGHSSDGTWEELEAAVARHPERRMRYFRQPGRGKGDAVRTGFAAARNDVLMILDADLTVPPEDLPKFYRAITEGAGEFVNGSRLVYPMERRAMRFANMVGNKFFALAFSYLLGQPLKDTLCGTKVLSRASYDLIARERLYFGDFDPFGDFDLLFGASRLGLKIVELPVRYRERSYGTTNIRRWVHGMLLLRMTAFAARRMKFL